MRMLLEVKDLHAAYGTTSVLHGVDIHMREGAVTVSVVPAARADHSIR